MTHEITEDDILKLVDQAKANVGENWIIAACMKEIIILEATIMKLRQLVKLCENPEVVAGIELFVGKAKL